MMKVIILDVLSHASYSSFLKEKQKVSKFRWLLLLMSAGMCSVSSPGITPQ